MRTLMKFLLLLVLFTPALLTAQQYVIHLSDAHYIGLLKEPNAKAALSNDTAQAGIVISDTLKKGQDPDYYYGHFNKHPGAKVEVFVLTKDTKGNEKLRHPSLDEMLRFSTLSAENPLPEADGYFILKNTSWKVLDYYIPETE